MTVRVATDTDVASLAALRRAWTDEYTGSVDDAGAFEREFADWHAAEPARTMWIALAGAAPVGMLNLAEFRRMPRPGQPPARWGYIANVFVLAAHRNRGLGRELLDAALAAARERHYARLVLSPSPRSVPFYRRAGFVVADELLVRRLA